MRRPQDVMVFLDFHYEHSHSSFVCPSFEYLNKRIDFIKAMENGLVKSALCFRCMKKDSPFSIVAFGGPFASSNNSTIFALPNQFNVNVNVNEI